MSDRSNAFRVVNDRWIEEEKRSLTYREYLELFYTRLERLNDAKEAIEHQAAHNQEARMRLRREVLEQAAQAGANDELIRTFLPDMSDPVTKLIDLTMELLNQLYTVARERPALQAEMQVNVNELASALSITPALIRSAMIGIDWPIQEKLNRLANLSLQRDFDIHKPNNTKQVEDEDENTHNPA